MPALPFRFLSGKSRWIAGILAVVLGLLWKVSPAEAVLAVASLSDPSKLATLGKRQANPRLNKIVYWLDNARGYGLSAERTVRLANWWNGTTEPRAGLVQKSLLRNLALADEYGLWTAENRERLRRGGGGLIRKGPYAGDSVEIDHIVPVSLAPEIGNELANLEMMPGRLNRSKSDQVGERELEHARLLLSAGLLTPESWERVQARKDSLPTGKSWIRGGFKKVPRPEVRQSAPAK